MSCVRQGKPASSCKFETALVQTPFCTLCPSAVYQSQYAQSTVHEHFFNLTKGEQSYSFGLIQGVFIS